MLYPSLKFYGVSQCSGNIKDKKEVIHIDLVPRESFKILRVPSRLLSVAETPMCNIVSLFF